MVAGGLTKQAILDALRARHAYATTDRNLRIICRVEDGLCGDIFAAPAVDTELSIAFDIHDDDEPDATYQIEVYADVIGGPSLDFEDPIEERLFEGNGTFEIPHMRYHGGHEYYVFRITQFGEEDDNGDDANNAWLAPVWFEPAGEPVPRVERVMPNAVAASGSELFHSGECEIAEGIAEGDRVAGTEAIRGRSPHVACVGEIHHTHEHSHHDIE